MSIASIELDEGDTYCVGEEITATVRLTGECCGDDEYTGATEVEVPLPNDQGHHANETVELEVCEDGVSGSVPPYTVVAIEKIIDNDSDDDDEGPAHICLGSSLTLRAVADPDDASFPSGHPTWTIVAKPDDSKMADPPDGSDTVTITPDVAGTYTIEAACCSSTQTFTIHAVQIKSLTVSDSNYPDTVTATSPGQSELFVCQPDLDEGVPISISAEIVPGDDVSAALIAWKVTGANAIPSSGSFGSGGVRVTLKPAGPKQRTFTVTAGCDGDGDGEPDAPTHTIKVHVVHVESVKVADNAPPHRQVVSDGSAKKLFVCQRPNTSGAAIRITPSILPEGFVGAKRRVRWDVDGENVAAPASGHFGSGDPTVTLNPKNDKRRDFDANVGCDCDDNQHLSRGEAAFPIAVTVIRVYSLTVQDRTDDDNQVTTTGGSAKLYLDENRRGKAFIRIHSKFAPRSARREVLWEVKDANKVIASGDFSGRNPPQATLSTAGGQRDFTVNVGWNGDGKGTLTPIHTVHVQVLKVELTVHKPKLKIFVPLEKHNWTAKVLPKAPPGMTYEWQMQWARKFAWYEMDRTSTNAFTQEARVAGKFHVRVKAHIGKARMISNVETIEVCFPTGQEIMNHPTVSAEMTSEWNKTLADSTPDEQRERGFWIRVDTVKEKWDFLYKKGTWLSPARRGRILTIVFGSGDEHRRSHRDDLLDKPTYSVAWFHTHPPTELSTPLTSTGPSDPDRLLSKIRRRPGLLYDYDNYYVLGTAIPPNWPATGKNDKAKVYGPFGDYDPRPMPSRKTGYR